MIRRAQHFTAQAFALPTILIASVVMLIVILSAITTTISVNGAIDAQYYTKIGQEAGESGIAMATNCIETTDSTTWTNALQPGTDCNGVGTVSYVLNTSNIRTSFSVPTPTIDAGGVNIKVNAKVELLRTSNGQPWKTFTQSSSAVMTYNNFDIISGGDATCALNNGSLWCWGDNANGGIGTGAISSGEATPFNVTTGQLAGKYVFSAATGYSHTCAIAGTMKTPTIGDTKIYCWGVNNRAQMGNGVVSSDTDRQLLPAQGATSLATSLPGLLYTRLTAANRTCAIGVDASSNSRVWCWGENENNQSGDNPANNGTNNSKITPTTAAAAIPSNTTNAFGAIRRTNNTSSTDSATNSLLINDAQEIAGSSNDTGCTITATNLAYCWGSNSSGQLGIGTVTNTNVYNPWRARLVGGTLASPTSSNYRFLTIQTNLGKICAIGKTNASATVTGKIYCWGANGNSSGTDYRMTSSQSVSELGTPTAMVTSGALVSATFSDVEISDWDGCALRSDGANAGKVYCWGYNNYGQLGTGTASGPAPVNGIPPSPVAATLSPNNMVQVGGLLSDKTVVKLIAGNHHFCAVTSTGTSYCWGQNDRGQLGNGTISSYSATPTRTKVPVRINIY